MKPSLIKSNKSVIFKFSILFLFAVAMGFLEAAVVSYLRILFYSKDFYLSLAGSIFNSAFTIEIVREFSTLVMLVTVPVLAGRKFIEGFSYFLFIFAVWDIFYYVFLKIIINWPSSFLEWDVLFLIPLPWLAPVLSPLICTVIMIFLSVTLFYFSNKYISFDNLSKTEWLLIAAGSVFIIFSFIWDYTGIVIKNFHSIIAGKNLQELSESFVPKIFHWEIFGIGIIILILTIILIFRRARLFYRDKIENKK